MSELKRVMDEALKAQVRREKDRRVQQEKTDAVRRRIDPGFDPKQRPVR